MFFWGHSVDRVLCCVCVL